jgi:hypothetical protein
MSLWTRGVICAGLITVLACESNTAGPREPNPDPDPDPSSLVLQQAPQDAGNGQEALRGTELPQPLRVRVTRDGVPVAGVPVTWSPYLVPAGGTVTAHGATDKDGIATATWTLGVAGALQVAAELENGARVVFQARALQATLEILAGDNQQGVVGGPLPEPVRLRVHFGGLPLSGETIVVSGTGAFEDAEPTDASGETSVQIGMRTIAGPQLYYFRTEADGPQAQLRLVKATALPDVPSLVSWSGPSGGVVDYSAGAADVLVRDQWGNPVPGSEVSWRFVAGSGTFEAATTYASDQGYARATFTMHSSASAQLGATVGSMVELLSTEFRASDITYGCPWGCWIAPKEITRPAGSVIRFQGSQSCWFETPVPGIADAIPNEFTLATPGTYDIRCPDGYYYEYQLGRIIVTP